MLDSGLPGRVLHAQVGSLWWRGSSYYDLWWRGTWKGFPDRDEATERALTDFYERLPRVRYEGHTGQIDNLLAAHRWPTSRRTRSPRPQASGNETTQEGTGMPSQDGMNYAPSAPPKPVCSPGDLVFAAVGLDHGHINGMCNGLIEARGQLRWVYDNDPDKVAQFRRRYLGAEAAPAEDSVLADDRVHLVASAAIPARRAGLGLRVMAHAKHYFTDKPPMTTLAQLAEVRAMAAETGRKYAVYFSERLHVESAVFAGQLVSDGAIAG